MPPAIRFNGGEVDLSPRYFYTETVAGSPATSAETIIASLTINQDIALQKAIRLSGYFAFTAGTDAATAVVRIRRTDVSGTVVKASGANAVTAAALYDRAIIGVDEGVVPLNQVYVLTLIVASASAASTVSAVTFDALVI